MKNGKSKILGKIFLLIMIFLILKGCGVFNEPETKTRSKNTFRIILYSALGIITLSSLKYSVILMPFMLAGLFLGIKSGTILDEKNVKKLVIILLIISGVMLIVKNL